jgi:hypothetical protein
MKKVLLKISDCLNQKSNFLGWLFLVLVIEYLFLFSLETILPGFVTVVFNLNFLLLVIVVIWLILTLVINNRNQNLNINLWLSRIILAGMSILIGVSLIFVLYKTSLWEFLIYLVFVFISGWFLYDYLKQK